MMTDNQWMLTAAPYASFWGNPLETDGWSGDRKPVTQAERKNRTKKRKAAKRMRKKATKK